MFEAEFTYTHKIVRYIGEIASANEVICNAKIINVYDGDLKEDALIRSSHYSTSMEGNTLNLDEVRSLIKNNKKVTSKEEERVLNYFNVSDHISRYCDEIITKNTVLSIYRDFTGDLEGGFRQMRVFAGNMDSHKLRIIHDGDEVVESLEELFYWLNISADEIYPVIVAGIIHYELERIRPFSDENMCVLSLVDKLVLSYCSFGVFKYLSLEEYYHKNMQIYSNAVNRDLTGWLEYFCQGVLYEVKNLKSEVLKLEEVASKSLIDFSLNEISVLTLLEKKGYIQNRDIQEMLNISHQASYKIIKKLKDKGLIKIVGKGRNTGYVLN